MIDFSKITTKDKDGNIYLTSYPKEIEKPETIIEYVLGLDGGINTLSKSYYGLLLKLWDGKLERYPVGSIEKVVEVKIYGFSIPLPTLFLKEIQKLYVEVRDTYIKRDTKRDIPLISAFVKKGGEVLRFVDKSLPIEIINREIVWDTLSIYKEETEEGVIFKAKRAGYFFYSQNGLEVLTPILDRKDNFTLMFQLLPITEGFNERAQVYREFLEKHRKKYPHAPIADDDIFHENLKEKVFFKYWEHEMIKGIRPVPGSDSEFVFKEEELHDEGGQVDHRDHSGLCIVSAGDTFAYKTLFVEGTDGLDIFGKTVHVRKGEDKTINPEGPISVEREMERFSYEARQNGIVTFDGKNLTLSEVLIVQGDVDYHTGNIRFDGDIIIKGDVKGTFSVISGGNMVIHGSVENRALVQSEKKLKIRGGILGEESVINAGEELFCSFIQGGHISGRKSITVEKSILNAHVYSRGDLKIKGMGLSNKKMGVISGSKCWSFSNIMALSAGSYSNETLLFSGYDFYLEEKIEELENILTTYKMKLSQVSEKIPYNLSKKEDIERVKRLSTDERNSLIDQLKLLKKMNSKIEGISKKKNELMGHLYNEEVSHLSVKLKEGLKGPVSVQFEEAQTLFNEERGPLTIQYNHIENFIYSERG